MDLAEREWENVLLSTEKRSESRSVMKKNDENILINFSPIIERQA